MPGALLTDAQRRALTWGVVAIALLAAGTIMVLAARRMASGIAGAGRPRPPVVTHDVAVERLRAVARLVSSEMTLRDVVTYRQTRYGSTKQTLLVVTARVTAGIDLQSGARVRIDSVGRRITVTLPRARIFGVDVVSVRTYDERAGLLNPFRPQDRDAIQQRTRAQLMIAAQQSGILEHADESAATLLRSLLAQDGYTVTIDRPITLEQPTR